jgi:hypothetical protein
MVQAVLGRGNRNNLAPTTAPMSENHEQDVLVILPAHRGPSRIGEPLQTVRNGDALRHPRYASCR